MQSVYQTAHCLNQDVVGLCNKKYANEFPRDPTPCSPTPAPSTGSFSRHKLMVAVLRKEQSHRKTRQKEASRINQISPIELFKKHTTKKTTPNHPAQEGEKIVLNRIACFFNVQKLGEFLIWLIYSQRKQMQQGFKMLHFLKGILHHQTLQQKAVQSISMTFSCLIHKMVLIVVPVIFDRWED